MVKGNSPISSIATKYMVLSFNTGDTVRGAGLKGEITSIILDVSFLSLWSSQVAINVQWKQDIEV